MLGDLPELFLSERRERQPLVLKRSFAVRPAELLAAHLAARMVGERVQVVASARVGRVERELDAQNPEQLPVARLVGAESPGGPGALAYVGHPAVAALSLDPALSPALVLPLGRPARAALGFLVIQVVLVRQVAELALARHLLQVAVELLGLRDVQVPAGFDIGVVDDDVRVRDAVLVVVVVDDGHLVVPEMLLRPSDCELAQAIQVDLVGGVGANDVVAVCDGGLAAVGLAVAVERPQLVHLGGPTDGLAAAALHAVEVHEVVPDGAPVALEVALGRGAAGVAVDALH